MINAPETKLGEVAEFIRGINFKPDDVLPLGTEGSVGCMRTKNVQDELDCVDVWGVPKEFVRRDEQLLKEGDILVSSANSWNLVGKCCWIPKLDWPASFGGFVSVLRANPHKVDPRFLYRWFASSPTQALLRSFGQKTTNISNLNIERCLNLKLVLPPLPEQRRIAAILDQADALRARRREALAELDQLTQSIFIEMFGDPVTNPKGWPTGKLNELADLLNGYAFKSSDYIDISDVLNCRMSNIRPDGNFDSSYNPKYLPNDYSQLYKDFILRDGDVIIAMTDMANEPKILGVPTIVETHGKAFLLNQRVGKLIFQDRSAVEVSFLKSLLSQSYAREYFRQIGGGGLQINLGKKDLLGLPIYTPPIKLQKFYSSLTTKAAQQKHRISRTLSELDSLFSSLQHRAFRGEL